MMHNHILEQLGFVSVVPGIACCGDEDEEEYLQWIFLARKPQPDEGTIGLGHLLAHKAKPNRQRRSWWRSGRVQITVLWLYI